MKAKQFLLLFTCFFTLCMQAKRQSIIFETDMGNDVDDALAIDMLYKYAKDKRINLMAVMLNKEGDFPAQYIALLNRWYGMKNVPIGLSGRQKASRVAGKNYTQVVCEARDAKGDLIYKQNKKDLEGLLPAPQLYRKLLAKAKDGSVTIISVGFSTNLAMLLETKPDVYSPLSGKELVAKKVARLVTMAGHMENPTYVEYNVNNDIPSCRKVYEEWPTPIYTSPFELGLQICYPKESILNDFGWTKHHPIVDSYKAYLPKLEDRPTWDLTSVLYAIDPQDFFQVIGPGVIKVTKEGYTHYKPLADGRHYYLRVTPEQAVQIRNYFVKMITQKP